MKIDSKLLNLALKRVAPAIGSNNSVMPILNYALIENNKIRATNLNLTYVEDLASNNERILLPHKEAMDITTLIDDDIEIIQDDKQVTIKHGKNEFELGKPADIKDFPALPLFSPKVTFNADTEFMNAIKAASKFVLPAGAHATLCNICVNVLPDRIEIAGSDAFSFYLYTLSTGMVNQPIQANFLPNFARAVNDFSSFEVTIDDKFIAVNDSVTKIVMRLSDVKYPNYSQFFANVPPPNFFCQKKVLQNSLGLLSVYPTSGEPTIFNLEQQDDCSITLRIPESSKSAKSHFSCRNYVPNLPKIGLGIESLKNCISLMSTEDINFSFQEINKAVYVTDPMNTKVCSLVMPLLLK